ncbi:hypothetical protein NY057_05665 [Curtobacterium flaccumfaciens]|uniref:SEFIR domain-containing protein n=1 Tax=Curtobacterium flaccumfaciens TaxID=2035 RepID=UPI0022059E87|nr:SEFIR domain-containing protein [Curtobacterium flaccumfaciens]UWD83731.1 hypothetical protein NY057_05665 [Curtobacterium flaccumfaciens]
MARSDLEALLTAVRGIQADLVVSATSGSSMAVRPHESRKAHGSSPSVFISWAHSHVSWTPKQTAAWEESIATLASTLRQSFGVDADVDLFHLHESVDWTRYGQRAIIDNDRVIIVLSKAWAERWDGTNAPTEGAGAAREADALHGLFSRDQNDWQEKLLVAMLPGVDAADLPVDLDRVARVWLDPSDPDSYETLLRNLTSQPQYEKVPLGTIPEFPPLNSNRNLSALRAQLDAVRADIRSATRDHTPAGMTRLRQLSLQESALRGFIETALQGDN